MTDGLVTYCHDGSHFRVEASAVPLLKRGWGVRIVWKRAYSENTLPQWLRYIVTSDGWGIGGSAHSPDVRIRRIGPVYIDRLAGPTDLIVSLMQLRAACADFVGQANEERRARHAVESVLRELRQHSPSMRGGLS